MTAHKRYLLRTSLYTTTDGGPDDTSWLALAPEKQCDMSVPQPNPVSSAYALPAVFFLFASRPWAMRSRMLSRSLSSLSLVTSTLEGAMGMGTDWPLDFSRETRSMWMMYLRR